MLGEYIEASEESYERIAQRIGGIYFDLKNTYQALGDNARELSWEADESFVRQQMSNKVASFDFVNIDGERIETTPEHPFFTREYGWVAAGDLWKGAHVRKADGVYGELESIQIVQHQQ